MNVDEAMKVAKREVLGWYDDMHTAGPVLAAEVERLRSELAEANAALERVLGLADGWRHHPSDD